MSNVTRILVATDFSPGGRRSVMRAAQLASHYKAELRLAHAAPDWNLFSRWTSARQEHHQAISQHAERTMRDEAAWVFSQFGVLARSEIRLGRASRVIAGLADEIQPSLIVVGARGEHQPKVSPESLGGTTLKLLLHTRHPLLLARGWDINPYRVSIAAVHDPCEISNRVVAWGTSLVGAGDCHVLHAYEAPYFERTLACGVSESSCAECVVAAESASQAIVNTLVSAAAPTAHVYPHIVRGNPLGTLVTEIARYQPTLVVLGRREALGEPQEPFGTDGFRMAYHCPVDTLVVP